MSKHAIEETRHDTGERLLDVDQLVVEYPGQGFGKKSFRALHGVSLDVLPGETVGLVGESGRARPRWAARCSAWPPSPRA